MHIPYVDTLHVRLTFPTEIGTIYKFFLLASLTVGTRFASHVW